MIVHDCKMWSMMGGATQAGEEGDIDPAFLSSRKSQKYGADLTAAAAANVRSGDADLPTKAPLHERRAKFDQVSIFFNARVLYNKERVLHLSRHKQIPLVLVAEPTAACSAVVHLA